MILVVGASGTNGREVVARLAASGASVRALVRDRARAAGLGANDVELVQGELDDPTSLALALEGTEQAFFVAALNPRFPTWFRNFIDAARDAGTGRVVKLSAMGADPESDVEILRQHGETDRWLTESGLGYTILRPNSFYQNMIGHSGSIRGQGAFYAAMKDARQSLVDVRDIADVAVAVLTGTGHEGRTYEITGPESLSYDEVAGVFSRVLGKPVRYVDVPPAAARDAMVGAGMAEWNARAIADLFASFATGAAARTSDAVERITGRPPVPLEPFVREFETLFR